MTKPAIPATSAAVVVDPLTSIEEQEEAQAPACVMSFNASEASGAGGLGCDIATIAAMGAHCLPVVTAIILRDTAETFEHHTIDSETIAEQARLILEDVPISAWKVGFLGSPEGISAVAEVLSDYPDVPLVAYLPNVSWLDEEQQQSYLDAFRELVLPQTHVLVGNHKTLSDFLLPDWDADRPASPRELAVAAGQHGTAHVLVTGISMANQFVDNVLANSLGPITGEKFERLESSFIGAGDTLSASLAALLSVGAEIHSAVGEALSFLDQALDSGFRPGMGNAIPDRFFWALPPSEEEEAAALAEAAAAAANAEAAEPAAPSPEDSPPIRPSRRMH
ncbi:MAG: bifunctional hydroxymethylpyrimidine kinase/phosphomethylpyrimidine kinase [Paucibacter sp.]|nr:bifunctional hydroxymethylpyrimidine kinase/phosphomethylpyrimidine kinase [Roseateles sp.]